MPKKYKYTKKTGRPEKTLDDLLAGWQDIVVNEMSQGKGICAIRVALSLYNYDTYIRFLEEYQEFSDVIKKGQLLCELWWREQGRENLKESKFNHGLWYMNMKNRFQWSDKQDLNIQGDLIIEYGHRAKKK